MTVTTRGERELALRFETFPARARQKIESRITSLIESLQSRAEAAAPRLTGALQSEITGRVYGEPNRIAGYVSVYAPGVPREYAKAATLETGAIVQVPMFVETGDKLKIDTRDGRYVTRV